MRSFLTVNSIVALAFAATKLVTSASAKLPGARNRARDVTPLMPSDPNTTKYCSYWWDTEGSFTCEGLVELMGLDLADFIRWNPSITATCGNFESAGQSYCIEVDGEPLASTTLLPTNTITSLTSFTTRSSSSTKMTTTSVGNGIPTPSPYQAGMTTSCNSFRLIESGDECGKIAAEAGISLANFYLWNPAVGSLCTSLWGGYYVCINVVGGSKPMITTNSVASKTSSGNGVATPTPTLPNMTTSCNDFHLVESGDQCGIIAKNAGISLANFYAWNPSVGTTCAALYAGSYVCVGVIGCTLLSPPPSQQYCGRVGIPIAASGSGLLISYSKGNPYTTTVAACAAKCLNTPACTSFYFTAGSSCSLRYGPISFSPNGNAGSAPFYQQSCFQCPSIVPIGNTCAFKSPLPSDTQCGRVGVPTSASGSGLLTTYSTNSPYVSSVGICAAKCLNTPACTSFYFTAGSSCSLRYGPISFSPNGNAGSAPFYQASCFSCPSTATCALASPLPSNTYCGRVGLSIAASGTGVLVAYSADSPYVSSIGVCAAQCLATSTCTSFYFKHGSSCTLHYGPVSFSPNGNAGSAPFYEIGCFPSCQM